MDYIKMKEVIAVVRDYIKNDPDSFDLFLDMHNGVMEEYETPVTEYEVLTVLDELASGKQKPTFTYGG